MNKKEKVEKAKNKYNISDILLHPTDFTDNACPKKTALKISTLYLLMGALWILFSDKLLLNFTTNKELLSHISMGKGWFYVLLTAVMLYFLIKISFSRIQFINIKLLKNYKELANVYEKLAESESKLQSQIEKLQESEERYRLVSEVTNDGIWDEGKDKRNFSDRWFEITGYDKKEFIEQDNWFSFIHPDDVEMISSDLERHKVNRDPNYSCEFRLRYKDGNYRWVLSKAKLFFNDNGEIIRCVGSHTDISELKKYEDKLRQLAYEDYLTSIPNRVAFYETVKNNLDNYSNGKKALMFIDIDKFKYINDTLGHLVGDKLISEIGKRLVALSNDNKSIYRIGGDEFIVFIHQYEDIDEVNFYAKEVLQSFEPSFKFTESTLNVTASLGIALYPLHGNNVDTLLRCADMAMYKAKSTAPGGYSFYTKDMDIKFQERVTLENELWKALERNEFSIYYQPQVDVVSGKINSMEALLRWKNEKLGSVSPLKFISVAEETNLINPIGDWVLVNACNFLKKIHNRGYSDINMSVNISIIQLMHQDFTEKVMSIISKSGIEPKYIELEITESILIESYDSVNEKLIELKSKGVNIALDDFGKGYSSLSYLTHIPLNTLKIDKVFIDTILNDSEDKSLTSMIIMIGQKLGLSIVAEGVETETQLAYLKKHNCHKIQGYYFSKPLPEHEVLELLNKSTGISNKE